MHEHREIWGEWETRAEFQFAIIRNPYARFDSKARQLAQELERTAPAHYNSVLELFRGLTPGLTLDTSTGQTGGTGTMDNHFRPQVDFLGEYTHCYRLEDHIPELMEDLVRQDIVPEGSILPVLNSKPISGVDIPWLEPEYREVHAIFKKYYATDFQLFNYRTLD